MSLQDIHHLVILGTSQNPHELEQAREISDNWEHSNFAQYIGLLSSYLCDDQRDGMHRYLAGILLKNCMASDDYHISLMKNQRWVGLDGTTRNQLKSDMFNLFSNPARRIRDVAAWVVSAIGCVEVPLNMWDDFFHNFQSIVQNQNPLELKWSAIISLKYATEDLDPPQIEPYANEILSTVMSIIETKEDMELYLEALQILESSLRVSSKFFEQENERNILMNTFLEAMTHQDERVRKSGYSTLLQVLILHYDKLESYMPTFSKVTLEHIQNDHEDTIKFAISFWSTICEIERDFDLDGRPYQNKNYSSAIAPEIIPLLLQNITKQESYDDPDEFTVPRLSVICLNLIGQTIEENLVPLVIGFIEENIFSSDWRFQDAAVLALSAIIEAPTTYIFKILRQTVPVLIELSNSQNTQSSVKATVSWVLARLCLQHSPLALEFLNDLISTFLNCLGQESKVADNGAWGLHNVALEFAVQNDSAYFKRYDEIVQALLQAGDRPDSHENSLKSSIYQALNLIVYHSQDRALENLFSLLNNFIDQQETLATLLPTESNKESAMINWGVIQMLLTRLRDLSKSSWDRLVACLFAHLDSPFGSEVAEEVFLTFGSYCSIAQENMFKNAPKMLEYCVKGLGSCVEDFGASSAIIGVISDISTEFGSAIIPFAEPVIVALFESIANDKLSINVKPMVITALGDLSYSLGDVYDKYTPKTVQCLENATGIALNLGYIDPDDEELIMYYNLLRQSILEGYTSLFRSSQFSQNQVASQFESISALIENIAECNFRNEGVANTAIGIAGDLANTYPPIKDSLKLNPNMKSLLEDILEYSDDQTSTDTARWAAQIIFG